MTDGNPRKKLHTVAAGLRVCTALLILALFLFAFAKGGQAALLAVLMRSQLSPSLIRGGILTAAAAIALTMLFGRVYCSILCPMGTLQEVFWQIPRVRKKKARRMNPPRIRYLVPLLAGAGAVFGIPPLMVGLDPVSIFGRGSRGYALLLRGEWALSGIAVSSLILFTFILLLSLLHGRRFCDWCPVGVALGFPASIAPLGVRIDGESCVSCGICEQVCPLSCADSGGKRISRDRCVLCGRCAAACPTGAARYGSSSPRAGEGRRKFLGDGGRLALGALSAAAYFCGLSSISAFQAGPSGDNTGDAEAAADALPILPPGAGDSERYSARCVGCQACAAACPVGIVAMKNSPQPVLNYGNGYCQYNCTDCSDACPTGALRRLAADEKRRTRVALSELNIRRCVVVEMGQACGACAEVCPTHALRMQSYEEAGGLPMPTFDETYCIGCGACLFACPVKDEPRAIEITGVPLQTATPGIRPQDGGPLSLPGMEEDFPF